MTISSEVASKLRLDRKIAVSIWKVVVVWALGAAVIACGLFYFRLNGILPPGNDTYIFVNALHNFVSGNGLFTWTPHQYPVSAGKGWSSQSQLGVHAQPFLFVLAPIYALLPSVYSLLVLQAFALGVAAVPLFKVAEQTVNRQVAWVVAFSYLLFPTVFLNARFFHPITFFPLFLFTMLYAYQRQHTLLFALTSVLALSLKESTPLVLAPLGVWLLFDARRGTPLLGDTTVWRTASSTLLTAVAGVWFITSLTVFMPAFSNTPGDEFTTRYDYLGGSLPDIVQNSLTKPLVVLQQLVSVEIFLYTVLILLPLAFLPLRAPTTLLFAIPVYLMNALSTFAVQHSFHYQHQIMLVSALIIGLVAALATSDGEDLKRRQWYLAVSVPGCAIIYTAWFGYLFIGGGI